MKKIKVGIVNYLNTAPLVYGLENSAVSKDIELIADYPSNLAKSLKERKIDLGLVPVAVMPELDEGIIVGDYCIGCDGAVASVCLFSEVPLENVDTLILDYQSRTSIELAAILLREYWHVNPVLVQGEEDFRHDIHGNTAGLVIGDRALEQRRISKYRYDLGEAWKTFTGLPFVFAAWVGNRRFDPEFTAAFNEANAYGIDHLEDVISEHPYEPFDLRSYFRDYVSYRLDAPKRQGLALFLEYLRENAAVRDLKRMV